MKTPDFIQPQRTFLVVDDPISTSPSCSSVPLQSPVPPPQSNLNLQQKCSQFQNSSAIQLDVNEKIIPVIIDITDQVPPPELGLHGSLKPEAFLSYAADLVGFPSKSLYPVDKPSSLTCNRNNVIPAVNDRSTQSANVDLDVR